MLDQSSLQKLLFDTIKQRETGKSKLLPKLMELLGIGKGALYKRMNGDTALTITEMMLLAEHYKLSLDAIFRKDKFFSFTAPFKSKVSKGESDFLNQFKQLLAPLKAPSDTVRLTYLANELPIFYYFRHKYIFNFLMAVWNHLHWSDERLVVSKSDTYDTVRASFAKDFTDNYYSHNITEIWNSNMLNNLYQQIIFCVTIRSFDERSYINRLIEDIQKLIDHLKAITVDGANHSEEKSFQIYLNDFGNYLNLVLYESDETKSTFVGYDYPHFIQSPSQSFHAYSTDWIGKLRGRSILISGEGYQQKELFFMKLERDFDGFKNRVQKLMNVYYD